MYAVKCGMELLSLHRLSLELDQQFHPTLYNGCNNLSMLGLNLNYFRKRGPTLTFLKKKHDLTRCILQNLSWDDFICADKMRGYVLSNFI